MSWPRRARTALLSAVILAVGLPLASVYAAPEKLSCEFAGTYTPHDTRWLKIAGPQYADGEGGNVIADFAVSPHEPSRLFVTNGKTIKKSGDVGCHWSTIYPQADESGVPRPPTLPIGDTVAVDAVDQIIIPDAVERRNWMWVVGHDVAGGVYRPRLFLTSDTSVPAPVFEDMTRNLPPNGRPVSFAFVPENPRLAFIVLEQTATASPTGVEPGGFGIYATAGTQTGAPPLPPPPDTGHVWVERSTGPFVDQPFDIALDTQGVLHAWAGNRYTTSRDAASTFAPPRVYSGDITAVDIRRSLNTPVVSIFYRDENSGGRMEFTVDGGKTFSKSTSAPGPAQVATHGPREGLYAVATDTGVWGFDLFQQQWINITPKPGGHLANLTMTLFATFSKAGARIGEPLVYGHTGDHIYRMRLFPPAVFAPPRKSRGVRLIPDVIRPKDGTRLPPGGLPVIIPSVPEITIAPDELADVPLDFKVPPDPTPVDVYFLVDTTSSMDAPIKGIRAGLRAIVDSLIGAGADARFGAGEFTDISEVPQIGPDPNSAQRVYRRLCPIAPVDTEDRYVAFQQCLIRLQANGRGGDDPEAQTIALSQAAKGNGVAGLVRPGQQPGYRDNSVKLIVFVTDSAFHGPESGPAYPSLPEAIDALVSENIKVIGIVTEDRATTEVTREQMRELVEGTGAVAPPKGIDCNGDGVKDLAGGEPLACETANAGEIATGVVPAIISLLLGIEDPAYLCVVPDDPYKVIKRMAGRCGDYNRKISNLLPVKPTVSCSPLQDGQDLPVRFVGVSRTDGVAEATVIVHCRGPVIVVPPPPRKPPPVLIAIIPPLIPPVPIPPANPPPPPNPPNPYPNTGFAQQENKQFQVATVGQDSQEEQEVQEEEQGVTYEMSAIDRDDPSTAPLLLGSVILTTIAAGALSRRRVQLARERR